MPDTNRYKNAIWTNHALERIKQRKLSIESASQTLWSPDISLKGKQSGTFEYQKKIGALTITVIATQNEKREWVVVSCWIDPPLPGSIDIKKKEEWKKYKKVSVWGKFLYELKKQLGF